MSYAAGRWAQAHTLVVGRDPHALAALKELADSYRDDDGACCIESFKELALSLGLSKPETASAAVSRLAKLGLVRASNIYSGRVIVGTRFELLGYSKDEWPANRKGKRVWVEVALSKGFSPMHWWPKVEAPLLTGDPQSTGDPRKTGVPRETGDGTPRDGELVPRETGEGSPAKRGSYKGSGKGMERDKERGCIAPTCESVPVLLGDVPFPDFEEPPPPDEGEGLVFYDALDFGEEERPQKPTAKKKRKSSPLVPCPTELSDDWAREARELRPEIDPFNVFRKFRCHYGPGERKAIHTWRRTFFNWIGRERNHAASYANDRGPARTGFLQSQDGIDYTLGVSKDFRLLPKDYGRGA